MLLLLLLLRPLPVAVVVSSGRAAVNAKCQDGKSSIRGWARGWGRIVLPTVKCRTHSSARPPCHFT